jgi:hypothetical protein
LQLVVHPATATPATQAAHDLAVIREANPDCSVTQNIHINNGTASSTFSTSGANVSIQDFWHRAPPDLSGMMRLHLERGIKNGAV